MLCNESKVEKWFQSVSSTQLTKFVLEKFPDQFSSIIAWN